MLRPQKRQVLTSKLASRQIGWLIAAQDLINQAWRQECQWQHPTDIDALDAELFGDTAAVVRRLGWRY